MRLVGPNGEQVGIVRVEDALRLAAEADLDLVEVAPMARPPVAKLMDFGKFKYEAALKAREARKNQVNTIIKEIKLRPKIDPHDYGTKKGHVERFLKAGDKVKVTIMFRGREQSRPELGFRLLQRLAEDVNDLAFVESSPKQDGRNMIMVLGPTRKKAEARAEQRRRRDDTGADGGDQVEAVSAVSADDELQQEIETATQTVPTQAAPAPAASAPVASAPVAPAPAAETPAPLDTDAPAEPEAPAAPAVTPEVTPAPAAATTPSPKPTAAKPAAAKPAATPRPTRSTPAPAATPAPSATPSAAPRATPRPTPRPAPKAPSGPSSAESA